MLTRDYRPEIYEDGEKEADGEEANDNDKENDVPADSKNQEDMPYSPHRSRKASVGSVSSMEDAFGKLISTSVPFFVVLPADGSDLTDREVQKTSRLVHFETQAEAESSICGPAVVVRFQPRISLGRSDLLEDSCLESDPIDLVHSLYKETFDGCDWSIARLSWPRILPVVSAWFSHGNPAPSYWEALQLHQMDVLYLDKLQVYVSRPEVKHTPWCTGSKSDRRGWSVIMVTVPDYRTYREKPPMCSVQ
jgi:hypothetical protein